MILFLMKLVAGMALVVLSVIIRRGRPDSTRPDAEPYRPPHTAAGL